MAEYFNPYAINQVTIAGLNEKKQWKMFDISELIDGIQYSTVLEGQPGKLTFTLQKDTNPNSLLSIHNGNRIQFTRDKKGIFMGYVFSMGTDATDTYKITCYDKLRYLKNEETIYFSGKKVSEVFSELCQIFQLGSYEVVVPCDFVCPEKLYEGQTLFSILNDQLTKANIAANKEGTKPEDRKYYFIRDRFGKLELNEIGKCKTDLIIGEKSLLSSYQFEISIDKNTYNQIKVVKNDEQNKKRIVKVQPDSESQKVWGILQKVVTADEHMNEEQMREKAKQLLKAFNRETRTLKLSALGVDGIYAGSGIRVNIPKLRTKKYVEGKETDAYLDMWVVGATHNYSKGMHTMELDVAIP